MVWEGYQNMKQMNSDSMPSDAENGNTITETPKYIEKKECKDTGKSFERMCPKCGIRLAYKHYKLLLRANRLNACCRSCAYTGRVLGPMKTELREKIRHHHLNDPNFGKWMIGRKPSEETRTKISNALSGRSLSADTRKKLATSKLGDLNPAKRDDVRRKISETQKQNPRKISDDTREKLSIKSKAAMLRRIDQLGMCPRPNFNPTACSYFNKLNQERGWNLQHAMNGGEKRFLCYYPDAYDADRNIVVEYDESHHFDVNGDLKKKDVVRMNNLIKELGCQFYRYNEKTQTLKCFNEVTP